MLNPNIIDVDRAIAYLDEGQPQRRSASDEGWDALWFFSAVLLGVGMAIGYLLGACLR